jgi:hypothetical protein
LRAALVAELKGQSKHQSGTAGWIDLGIRAQEEQLSVAAMARTISQRKREPTATELLDLTKRRTQLRRLVDRFLAETRVYLSRPAQSDAEGQNQPTENIDEEVPDTASIEERITSGLVEDTILGVEWDYAKVAGDSNEEQDLESPDDILHVDQLRRSSVGDEIPPECILLPLPSSFSKTYRTKMKWTSHASVEADLRAGRLRDHLSRLREGIARKAFTWSHDMHHANAQRAQTRSLTRLKGLLLNIKAEAAGYCKSRTRYLQLLGRADEEFAELRASDLAGVRSYVDHTMRGHSRESASWIWGGGLSSDDYVTDRKLPSPYHEQTTTYSLISKPRYVLQDLPREREGAGGPRANGE